MGYYVHHFISSSNRKFESKLVTFFDCKYVRVENKTLARPKTENLIKIEIIARKLG